MWNSWTGCSTVTIVLFSFIMHCDGFLVHSIMMPFQLTNYELNTLAENLPLAESENENEMVEVSKKRDNYLDLFKQVHGQNSAKKEDLSPLHPLRYKKKLPMLRLKKSHHPLILADPVDDAGARLGRSKKIWFNDVMTQALPIPPSKNIKYLNKKRFQHPSQLSWYERLEHPEDDNDSNEEPSEIGNMEEVDDQLDSLEDFFPIFYGRGKKMLPLNRMGKRMLPLQSMGKRDEENELYPMRFKKRFTHPIVSKRKFIHPIASYLDKKSGREIPAWYKDRLAESGNAPIEDLRWFRGAPGI